MFKRNRSGWAVATAFLAGTATAGAVNAQAPNALPPVTPAAALPAPHPEPDATIPPAAPAATQPLAAPAPVVGDVAAAPTPGCSTCSPYGHHGCIGYAREFCAPPLGASVHAYGQAEVAKHEALSIALYDYDFVENCPQLSPRGLEQLAGIAKRLPRTFHCLTIEPVAGAPGLTELRRLFVINTLAQGPYPVPPERVVIARPGEIGLSGTDAVLIYRNQLGNTFGGPALARPASAITTDMTPPPAALPAAAAQVP